MSNASKSRVSGPLLGEYPGKSSMSVSRTSCAVGCALLMRRGAGLRSGDKRDEGPDMMESGVAITVEYCDYEDIVMFECELFVVKERIALIF